MCVLEPSGRGVVIAAREAQHKFPTRLAGAQVSERQVKIPTWLANDHQLRGAIPELRPQLGPNLDQ